jgi:hypothetical protein
MSEETRGSRRGFLKVGLASVAGVAAGHSILKTSALTVNPDTVCLVIPPLSMRDGYITESGRRDLLEALAPLIAQISEQSGRTLTPAQVAEVRSQLLERGQIELTQKPHDGSLTVMLSPHIDLLLALPTS